LLELKFLYALLFFMLCLHLGSRHFNGSLLSKLELLNLFASRRPRSSWRYLSENKLKKGPERKLNCDVRRRNRPGL
jgi:hypothetical protein